MQQRKVPANHVQRARYHKSILIYFQNISFLLEVSLLKNFSDLYAYSFWKICHHVRLLETLEYTFLLIYLQKNWLTLTTNFVLHSFRNLQSY